MDATRNARPTRSRRSALLDLVRAPNLLTVPGDPLAGFMLAAGAAWDALAVPALPRLAVALPAALAAYAGGMIDNDLVDLEHDRIERPARPLPAGEIMLSTACRLRTVLLALPLLLGLTLRLPDAWLVIHVALLAAIIAYNRLKNRAPLLGFLLMGLCRGLNLLSGAALLGTEAVVRGIAPRLAVWWWCVYIAGVTAFAATENRRGPGVRRFLLLAPHALVVACGWRLAVLRLPGGAALMMAGLAAWLPTARALFDCRSHAPPDVVRPTVGRLLRVLFPMQIVACLSAWHPAGGVAAALLAAGWIGARRLARRHAAS